MRLVCSQFYLHMLHLKLRIRLNSNIEFRVQVNTLVPFRVEANRHFLLQLAAGTPLEGCSG